VQVTVNGGGGDFANRSDVLSELLPARLLRQPLRDGNERHENGGRRQAGENEDRPANGLPERSGRRDKTSPGKLTVTQRVAQDLSAPGRLKLAAKP
jgi:hypothetical protein